MFFSREFLCNKFYVRVEIVSHLPVSMYIHISFLEFLSESCSCAPSQFLVCTDEIESLLLLLYSLYRRRKTNKLSLCIIFHRRCAVSVAVPFFLLLFLLLSFCCS